MVRGTESAETPGFVVVLNWFEDLKRLNRELEEKGVSIVGVGDHGVSIGVYFLDPDGNEMEAFYELPRDQWPEEGDIFSGKFPLGTLEEEPAPSPA